MWIFAIARAIVIAIPALSSHGIENAADVGQPDLALPGIAGRVARTDRSASFARQCLPSVVRTIP